MHELEQLRAGIRRIDRDLAALFEQRMELARQVALYKKQYGLPIKDAAQEKRVEDFYVSMLKDASLAPYLRAFVRQLIDESCRYQESCIKPCGSAEK